MAAGTLRLLGAVNQLFLSKPAGMRTGAHSRPAAAAGPPPSGSINQTRPPRPERRPRGLLCVHQSQAWEAGRRASGSPGPLLGSHVGKGGLKQPRPSAVSTPGLGDWDRGLICRASPLVGQRANSSPLCGSPNTVTPEGVREISHQQVDFPGKSHPVFGSEFLDCKSRVLLLRFDLFLPNSSVLLFGIGKPEPFALYNLKNSVFFLPPTSSSPLTAPSPFPHRNPHQSAAESYSIPQHPNRTLGDLSPDLPDSFRRGHQGAVQTKDRATRRHIFPSQNHVGLGPDPFC